MSKAVFLYTNKTKLTLAKIRQLEKAGFVCVAVESFDDVRILSNNDLNKTERILYDSALAAIEYAKLPSTLLGEKIVEKYNTEVTKRVTAKTKITK